MISVQKGSRPVCSSGHVQKSPASGKGILRVMAVHPRCREEADGGGGGI